MTKIRKPKLSSAVGTVKGYHSSFLGAVCAFFALIIVIAIIIVSVEARKVLSKENLTVCLAVLGAAWVLSASVFAGGLILNRLIRKKDCVIFFEDFIIIYEFKSLFNCGYYELGYEEIAGYGFFHELDKDAVKHKIYLPCDVFNYGKLIIKDIAGKAYPVPVGDIDKAAELLKTYTGKDETVYQSLKGVNC